MPPSQGVKWQQKRFLSQKMRLESVFSVKTMEKSCVVGVFLYIFVTHFNENA